MDKAKIRAEFPVLNRKVHGKDLVYFDNAASSQKPRAVVEAISDYYYKHHSNVHRGVHSLSQEATEMFEETRKLLQTFVNAKEEREIVYSSGTTESINLVARSFSEGFLQEGDEIIISNMEHHSNIVPWQMAAQRTGASLKFIPITDDGELDLQAYQELLSPKTKMVAVVHVSNALGTVNPVKEMAKMAHEYGAAFLLDGAQSAPHMRIDVQDLNCDFYAASAHKMFGPTGAGFLYGKAEWLEKLPPFLGGGEMISRVTMKKTEYNQIPFKFEAGTPNIAGMIGFGAAIKYMNDLGVDRIAGEEAELLQYALSEMPKVDGFNLIGRANEKASLLSFLIDGTHPYDVGTLLDQMGIAVRTGHHCTEPIMDRYGIPGTIRASFAFYNTKDEIDQLVSALQRASSMLR
jgi:cysteine desulfurase/selenocysteine lyase